MIRQQYETILERVAEAAIKAGRDPAEIRVMAVTKTQALEDSAAENCAFEGVSYGTRCQEKTLQNCTGLTEGQTALTPYAGTCKAIRDLL